MRAALGQVLPLIYDVCVYMVNYGSKLRFRKDINMVRTNNMLLIGIAIILVIIFVIVPVLYCTRYLHSGLLIWRLIGSMARHKEQGQEIGRASCRERV
jgi:predicted secreted Zn-dependent protease